MIIILCSLVRSAERFREDEVQRTCLLVKSEHVDYTSEPIIFKYPSSPYRYSHSEIHERIH